MSTLQQQIAAKFLARPAESKHIDAPQIRQLEKLLTDSKRPKADDFVKIFSLCTGGGIK